MPLVSRIYTGYAMPAPSVAKRSRELTPKDKKRKRTLDSIVNGMEAKRAEQQRRATEQHERRRDAELYALRLYKGSDPHPSVVQRHSLMQWDGQDGARIYFLFLEGRLMYIGKASICVYHRLLKHHTTKDYDAVWVTPVMDADQLDTYERNAIRWHKPPANIIRYKQR